MLTLKILGGVAALLLGVWLGLPGRYERRSQEELDRLLDHGGPRHKVKRHFTFIDWLHKDERASRRRAETRRLRTAAPEKKGE